MALAEKKDEKKKKNPCPFLGHLLPKSGLQSPFLGRALTALRSIGFPYQHSMRSDLLIAHPGSPNNVIVRPGARINIFNNKIISKLGLAMSLPYSLAVFLGRALPAQRLIVIFNRHTSYSKFTEYIELQ